MPHLTAWFGHGGRSIRLFGQGRMSCHWQLSAISVISMISKMATLMRCRMIATRAALTAKTDAANCATLVPVRCSA